MEMENTGILSGGTGVLGFIKPGPSGSGGTCGGISAEYPDGGILDHRSLLCRFIWKDPETLLF